MSFMLCPIARANLVILQISFCRFSLSVYGSSVLLLFCGITITKDSFCTKLDAHLIFQLFNVLTVTIICI